jgi:hypothetical protein
MLCKSNIKYAKRSKFIEINVYTRQRAYQWNWVVGKIQSRALLENKYIIWNSKVKYIFFGVYITLLCFDIIVSFLITLNSSIDKFRGFHMPKYFAVPRNLVWLCYHTRPSSVTLWPCTIHTLKLQLSRLSQGHGPWKYRTSTERVETCVGSYTLKVST